MSKLNQPIKWHGGKGAFNSKLARWIISLFPPRDEWDLFSEPFFGGGAVSFALDPEGVSETHNDIDSDLMQFWYVLSEPTLFEDFARRANATPFSERLFDEAGGRAVTQYPFRAPAVETALAFFVRYRQSRQALGKDFATPTTRIRRGMNEQVSAWLSAVDGLPEAHARVRRMEFRNMDALEFIRKFDHPKRLFYCDPPYLHETRTTTSDYRHEMTWDQHADLVTALAHLKGRFVLSGYRSELYDECACRHSWHRREFEIVNNASSKPKKERKIECVWTNYEPKARE